MDARELAARPDLNQYETLANDLVSACNSGDPGALKRINEYRQLDRPVTPDELRVLAHQRLRKLTGSECDGDELSVADARLLVAHLHGFESWDRFARFIEDVNREESLASQFEAAADAVVAGDLATLESMLRANPDLVRARSARLHESTLLHYVSANGVEDFRQKSPENSVDVLKLLLRFGAEVDAENNPGRGTTLGLVATSIHPAHAGVQIPLLEALLDAGASVDGVPGGWIPLNAALHNGRPEAAHFLAARGARLDLEGAAGVGRVDLVKSFFNDDGSLKATATKEQLESGFMWACEYGHTAVVEFLLDRGFDLSTVSHGMPGLHWAIIGGRIDTIKLLLDRGAPLELENVYGGNVIGSATWAVHWGDPVYRWPDPDTDWLAIVKLFIDAGAKVHEIDTDFPTGNESVDELLRRHGMTG
ncbi:MAG TPA: ankyrin repeat domain-containing protein [Blastocatellia bacterium]|nr:ankyrin repeat domain-containing protein [Blastocatellia bacterium]